jgi:hypothetical protein
VVFVTRESVDAWPEADPSIAAVGRGLLRLCKRACGDVLRARVRQSRFTDTDIDGARVGVLSCLVRGAGRVRVYVREGEALAVVGAELASGRSRAWPVSGDPVAAVHAALDWLRSATRDEAERPAVLG